MAEKKTGANARKKLIVSDDASDAAEESMGVMDEKQDAEVDDGVTRKKQIYEHVTVATGLRKRDVREAVDELLAYFHKTLSDGRDLQVPPLGKIRAIKKGEGDKVKYNYKVVLQSPKSPEKIAAQAQEALADGETDD